MKKAKKYLEKMSRKQIIVFVVLGIFLTSVIGSFPLLADATVKNMIGASLLTGEKDLTEFLRRVQTPGSCVYIGIHGYNHICPICGATTHELSCPNAKIPMSELERRIVSGVEIFNASGIRIDWYAFPGESYDDRCLQVLEKQGFTMVPYRMGGETRQMPVMELLKNFTFTAPISEYTWNWRHGITEVQYNQAISSIGRDKPVQLLVHIEDFTNQTSAFFEYAISRYNTTAIRCDDITSNFDLPKTKALVTFAREHNVDLLLAVIPTFKVSVSSAFSPFMNATWYLFLVSFMFPIAVMLPWATWFKFNRKMKPLKQHPSVSMILPAYNEAKIIQRSLEQVTNQDYKGQIEIIVIDDGSTDRTKEIVKAFAEKHSSVKLIEQPKNMGKPEALNAGFKAATGEISIFQDTDSVIAQNLVSLMIPHFQNPKVGMVAGMIVIENENNLLTKMQQIEYLFSQTVVRFCQATHQNVLICPGAATAVRTTIAREIPSTDRTVTEDADFSLEVWHRGWKITQEPEALSYTEAPEKMEPFIDQRKRWLYGVLQTIVLHKWALKSKNLWIIWAWLGYIMCPLTLVSLISPLIFWLMLGQSFALCFFVYTTLTLGVFVVSQAIGVLAFNRQKAKLLYLLPLYALYQLMMQLLLLYLVLMYITRKGIRVRYGGKIIHAIK